MNHRRYTVALGIIFAAMSPALSPVFGQRVVAIGDEWVFSNQAFSVNPAAAQLLAGNLGTFIANGQANANFLILTNTNQFNPLSFSIGGGNSVASFMTSQGYTWTHNPSATFNLATLQAYDAVFLCNGPGNGAANASVLTQYVNGGGSVVVSGGTGGLGGPSAEAAAWNPFLNTFGLQFNAPYIGPATQIQLPLIANTNPVGIGVPSTRWSLGHVVTELNPANPLTDIVLGNFNNFGRPGNYGVIGTYALPTPGSVALLGLAGIAAARRRRMA